MAYSILFKQCGSDHMTRGRSRAIDRIVVHFTATLASARNNATYFSRNEGQGASAHYESPPFPLTHRVPFGHDAVNGERGHGMGHPSPKYSAEFKQQAVRLYNERGTTYAEVARELGVDPGSLSDWVKRADAAQAPAGDNPFQMAEDLRRLRRENERLKRENEILLKASAFFASRQL